MEESSSLGNDKFKQKSIDRLPDELLISIVSHLSVKEAARTSVLARRWRYLWRFNPILEFDGSEIVRQRIKFVDWVNRVLNLHLSETIDEFRVSYNLDNRNAYDIDMDWVNRVLNLHVSETIDEFRVSYNLDNRNAYDIDINRWIEFAFTKRVKRLELNLERNYSGLFIDDTFPNICHPTKRLRISTCESLVSLHLTQVHVTREVLEFFISNCPFLEELFVKKLRGFESLRTSCQAIRLRRLEINECHGCRRLEICSPNLVSCTISGFDITMALKDVSSLINLSLGARMPSKLPKILLDNSACLSRLETLTLQTTRAPDHEGLEFPNLPRLKKLVFEIDAIGLGRILCFAPLINAAPLLREIVLKLKRRVSLLQRPIQPAQRPGKGQKHQCLKVFEIVGFDSTAIGAIEVALYVLENATSLEKMIINGRAATGNGLHQLKAKLASKTCRQDITGDRFVLQWYAASSYRFFDFVAETRSFSPLQLSMD